MQRPRQAVILAGGRGQRLRPLTDTCPKHMLPFHGRPFAAHLVEMLHGQGFDRVLFLLGYLPEKTVDYFGPNAEYSVSGVEDQTAKRLRLAASKLDEEFLLLYCDNYWPMRFHRMYQHWLERKTPAQMTVYRNEDGYSRSNVSFHDSGMVAKYDRRRTADGHNGVDIGYLLMKRDVLDLLPEGNTGIEDLYPRLVEKGQLAAYPTSHRYYGVGTPERMALTREFLARQSTILIDRDGVLNRRPGVADYVRSWKDWEWIDGAREALRLLRDTGHRVIVLSNQAGIARGVMRPRDLAEIDQRMKAEAATAGGAIQASYYCPHAWDAGCACRKPQPGMFFQAQRDFHLDLTRTWFIGDDARDGEAADAAGCLYAEVTPTRGLFDIVKEHLPQCLNVC